MEDEKKEAVAVEENAEQKPVEETFVAKDVSVSEMNETEVELEKADAEYTATNSQV